MLVVNLILLCLLATCSSSLPVIFGYHTPKAATNTNNNQNDRSVDCNQPEKSSQNDLFIARVNQPIHRPMALNTISYNENVDRSNYIPIELDSRQEELPADQDFHASYRRLVTRTVKSAPYYHYPMEDTPVFEYHSTESPQTVRTNEVVSHNKVEECFENSKLLPRTTIKKMNKRRRKLAQSIRRLNKLQRNYCLTMNRRPKQNKTQTRCSAWREEKMALYVKLLRLEHCSKDRSTDN